MSLLKPLFVIGLVVVAMYLLTRAMGTGDRRHEWVDISGLKATGAKRPVSDRLETATLAAGCFWCVEAVLERIEGVASVESGYTGGDSSDPTYGQISTGKTGHAEAVRIQFDPEILSYEQLLTVFWELHDPTTLNRQGADRGTQYRSAIFYHNDAQKKIAEASLAAKDASGHLRGAIVTEVVPAGRFHPAETYHQDYFDSNPAAGYSRRVIDPKLQKLGLLD